MITWLTIKALLLDENIFWTFAILLFTFSYIAFSILTIRGKCSSSFLYLAAMAFVASWLCIIPLNIGSFWDDEGLPKEAQFASNEELLLENCGQELSVLLGDINFYNYTKYKQCEKPLLREQKKLEQAKKKADRALFKKSLEDKVINRAE